MKKFYSIQEAAERAQLSDHTLRYYEKVGLVSDIERSPAGHRLYSEKDLEWISFLKFSQHVGMSIQQMQKFAALKRAGPSSAPERLDFLQGYYEQVLQQIKDREAYLSLLDRKIRVLQEKIATGNFALDSSTFNYLFARESHDDKS